MQSLYRRFLLIFACSAIACRLSVEAGDAVETAANGQGSSDVAAAPNAFGEPSKPPFVEKELDVDEDFDIE